MFLLVPELSLLQEQEGALLLLSGVARFRPFMVS